MTSVPFDWFDDLVQDHFEGDRLGKKRFYMAWDQVRQSYGGHPDPEPLTEAQRTQIFESLCEICRDDDDPVEKYPQARRDRTVSTVSSEDDSDQNTTMRYLEAEGRSKEEVKESKTASTSNDSDTVQESFENAHSEHKQEALRTQKTSMNSDHDSKASLANMYTPLSNNLSQSASQEVAKERGPLNMSKSNKTTEEQLASKYESTSDPWYEITQTTRKDETEVNKHLSKRVEHWKKVVAAKKHSSLDNEDEQSLPSDILDFNASMLNREDHDEMLLSDDSNKQWNKIILASPLEEVSPSEQATAINALLYGLTVLKAATPIQQHEMVTSLLHPKVCKMQPSLAFEMNALLLELDNGEIVENECG